MYLKHIQMRKYLTIIEIKRILGVLMFLGIFMSSNLLSAQNNMQTQKAQYDIIVPYGTSFTYDLEIDNIQWRIETSAGNQIKNGSGAVKNYVFENPGDYVLKLKETNPDPESESSIQNELEIKASSMGMLFDFSTINFSRNISGGQASGIILSVDAIYSSYDNTTAVYSHGLTTAGVDTFITGKLKNGPVELQEGINTLKFELEGQASVGNYIMFDFVDINGEVQAYGLTEIIK